MTNRTSRLRANPALRELVAETGVKAPALVFPFFVKGSGRLEEPYGKGVARVPLGEVEGWISPLARKGLRAVLLFGVPDGKDEAGHEVYSDGGVVQRAVRAMKSKFPSIAVITDVCMCQYTTHGHCGIVAGERIDRERTCEALAKVAVSHAKAGADMVAPSAMADGQVAAIRGGLDKAGFEDVALMSYSAKYASSLYAPFREAANSAPAFGDRSAYQMDFRNRREALHEAEVDVEEGADVIMIKPALPYLDVISDLKAKLRRPVAAYQVSGEYVMIKAYCERTKTDEERLIAETVTAIRRAGADVVISYFVPELLELIGKGRL